MELLKTIGRHRVCVRVCKNEGQEGFRVETAFGEQCLAVSKYKRDILPLARAVFYQPEASAPHMELRRAEGGDGDE